MWSFILKLVASIYVVADYTCDYVDNYMRDHMDNP